MKLDTILFFSDTYEHEPDLIFLKKLHENGCHVYWNPEHSATLSLDKSTTLIVTEHELGAAYANHNHIPYIEKWCDTYSYLCQKPVCYYDDIRQLTVEYLENQWKRAHRLPLTIAHTKRLTLRELTNYDIPYLYKIREKKEILAHLPALESLETELDKHNAYIKNQYEFFDYGLWGVFLHNGTLIGQAGIQNHEYHNSSMLELSYLIAPEYQKQGYATESILAVYQYAIEHLECNQMIAIIAKNNLASMKTAMNLGMKRMESVEYLGRFGNYYLNDNLTDFLVFYDSEQRRAQAARSAYAYAQEKPVQEVYKRYRSRKRVEK